MSTHADGRFQTLRIPLGGKGLNREEDQNDGAVASMQKVGSESYMKDQPQPRPTPKSNRQWEKPSPPNHLPHWTVMISKAPQYSLFV